MRLVEVSEMSKETFDCPECTAKIVLRLWHCGKRKRCPGCKVEIDVPTPSPEVARRVLAAIELPHPLPARTLGDYEALHQRLLRFALAVHHACDFCGYSAMASPFLDDVIRSLRSTKQFAKHVMQKNAQPADGVDSVSDALSQMVAGSDIGGIGISKTIKLQNDYWEQRLPDEEPPLDFELLDKIDASIDRLKAFVSA